MDQQQRGTSGITAAVSVSVAKDGGVHVTFGMDGTAAPAAEGLGNPPPSLKGDPESRGAYYASRATWGHVKTAAKP